MMTPRKCHVDRLFPSHMTRCWIRTGPPTVWAWTAYLNPAFWAKPSDTETLLHGFVINVPGSHSPTSTLTSSFPSATPLEPRVSVFL
jgi:hypothetical protein